MSLQSLLLTMIVSIVLFMYRFIIFFVSMIFSIVISYTLPRFDFSRFGFGILSIGAGLILLRLVIGTCCICLQLTISFLENVNKYITFGRIFLIEVSGFILIIWSICGWEWCRKWFGIGVFLSSRIGLIVSSSQSCQVSYPPAPMR